MVAHGYVRTTKDVDIVPSPVPENRRLLERALLALDAVPVGEGDLRREEMPVRWGTGALDSGGNWALQTVHGRVDVLQYIEGAPFVESYAPLRDEALVVDVPRVGTIRFASLDHLTRMKRVAARPQDLHDLAALADLRAGDR